MGGIRCRLFRRWRRHHQTGRPSLDRLLGDGKVPGIAKKQRGAAVDEEGLDLVGVECGVERDGYAP